MSFRISTQITVTARDQETECSPADLEQVGTHQIEFNTESLDAVEVHSTAIRTFKNTNVIVFPHQFDFEVAYPDGADVHDMSNGEAEVA